jgi:integrase
MATTHQRGWVTPRGKQWYGYFRKVVNDPVANEEKVNRVTVILGQRSQMSKGEAREALQREITKQMGQAGSANRILNDGSVTFAWFVRNRFIPLKEAAWKEETAKTKTYLIQRDLIDVLGEIPLVNFDKFSLQLHLNKLAATKSKDRVLQMRAYLRDIFAEAVDQDFLVKDPARKVKVPAQLRDTDTTTLTWDQLRMALNELSPRDRLLLELDMTNALRPSELFALKWKSFDSKESTMSVTETVYKGKIRSWGKTRKSLAVIHIPSGLSADLVEWRTQCPDPSPDAFIFSNQDGGFLDTDNYRKRVLHRLAKDLKLPKLTFQVIRRTIATLAQKKGTVKDVQGVLRHSRTATTTDVYMQEIPESVQATVNSINRELRKLGPEKTSQSSPKKKSVTVDFVGKRSSKRAMSERVFEGLTPNDTKRFERGSASFR